MGPGPWEHLGGKFTLSAHSPSWPPKGSKSLLPPPNGTTASRSRPVTPADGGPTPLWTTGLRVRHDQPLSPALKKLSPPSVSNQALAMALNLALRRSCCTNNEVNGPMLPCKLPAARGAAKWASGLSSNTKIRSRCLVGCTETQRSTCDEPRLPVVPPAPSELDLMQHNSPRTRKPFGVCRPTAKLRDCVVYHHPSIRLGSGKSVPVNGDS